MTSFRYVLLINILAIWVSLSFGYVSKCLKPGYKCQNCAQLVFCVANGADVYETIYLNNCNNSNNQYCSVSAGGCSSDVKVCKTFGLKHFTCRNEGIFPDPYDCTTFHFCSQVNSTSVSASCPDKKSFDPLSKTCRFDLQNKVCSENPVPTCTKPLQFGALQSNPNIYYICVAVKDDIVHELHRCEDGETFNEQTIACKPEKYAIRGNSVGRAEKGSICEINGEGYIFPDPKNTEKYYECDNYLKPVSKFWSQ